MRVKFAVFMLIGMALLQACGSQCPSGYTSVNGSCQSSYYPTTGYSPAYTTAGYTTAGYTTAGYGTGGYTSGYTTGYSTGGYGYPGGGVCPVGYPNCNGGYAH